MKLVLEIDEFFDVVKSNDLLWFFEEFLVQVESDWIKKFVVKDDEIKDLQVRIIYLEERNF